MLLCIESHLAERAEIRELDISVDGHRRKQRQAGTGEATAEPGSGSRNNEQVKDDEFDFRSYNPKKQADATADEDDWRKMKMESNGMNDLSRVRHSRTVASVKHPLNISNQQAAVQAENLRMTSG